MLFLRPTIGHGGPYRIITIFRLIPLFDLYNSTCIIYNIYLDHTSLYMIRIEHLVVSVGTGDAGIQLVTHREDNILN